MPGRGHYHHGDLRRAVVDAAVEIIARDGIGAVSLRDLARRAGVSHAAPAHHFKDKAGLLTAVAIEGFEMLTSSMEDALRTVRLPLLELGRLYVVFAIEHPGHFEVMYRPDVYNRDDPELLATRAWARRVLRAGVSTASPYREDDAVDSGALAVWSLAHGYATLLRSGNFDEYLGHHSPTDLFERIASRIPAVEEVWQGSAPATPATPATGVAPAGPGTSRDLAGAADPGDPAARGTSRDPSDPGDPADRGTSRDPSDPGDPADRG
ncbi:TetR/AcrR family transcriptional regulator [Saccharomonospora xinjiangensis]|uniref:TetR/AcrR family transcriptional regulator n=1 Tax=Saccharomonospora xinjiangensis TaxID=75294 RepID=UPI0010C37EB6|nr:transcriptional regulator BetI [Saccharomonospora xinjiangensis]